MIGERLDLPETRLHPRTTYCATPVTARQRQCYWFWIGSSGADAAPGRSGSRDGVWAGPDAVRRVAQRLLVTARSGQLAGTVGALHFVLYAALG